MTYEYRNPHRVSGSNGVDCEINHPVYGWIPTTALIDDPETTELYAALVNAGGIANIVPPTQAELNAEQRAADTRDLTPSEFEYLLAYTGLEDIWYGLEQLYKPSDRAQYAFLRGLKKKGTFAQAETLSLVAQFRPAASGISPTVDLSDNTIKAAWILAINSGV